MITSFVVIAINSSIMIAAMAEDRRQDVDQADDVPRVRAPLVRPRAHERHALVGEEAVHDVHRGPLKHANKGV